jgi:hypothetical protein
MAEAEFAIGVARDAASRFVAPVRAMAGSVIVDTGRLRLPLPAR